MVLILCLLVNFIAAGVSAEPVTTIRNNGDSANRVDIVILGDGYTSAQLSTYAADVGTFVQGIFAQEPYKEYQRYFNVHRIDVTSNESGADHPERNPPVFRDTALDAFYKCDPNASDARLLCVSGSKVNDVLSRSVPIEKRDIVLVIVNDPQYGGSGGYPAVASVHTDVIELILHELGHSFGLLADEYDTDPHLCNNNIEPSEPNVTKQTNRTVIKWNVGGRPPTGWIELSTPIPTTSTNAGIPGLYEGARYCVNGLFRPTYNSKMRSFFRPFEQINSEQLVKRVYNWASPIDAFEPPESQIFLSQGQTQTFRVSTPQPLSHSLTITWKVDGQTVGTETEITLDSTQLSNGTHSVAVTVTDPTSLVRQDSSPPVLQESQSWVVINDVIAPETTITSGPVGAITVNNATFSWTGSDNITPPANLVFAYRLDPIEPNFSAFGSATTKSYTNLANGNYTLFVKAKDHAGNEDPTPASQAFTVDVDEAIVDPLAITAISFLSGEVGVAYTAGLGVIGGQPPYSISVTSGALPSGLSFVEQNISGTPTLGKKAKFTITVTDQIGASVSRKYTLTIFKALRISSTSLKAGTAGRRYSTTLKATGGGKPFTWSLTGTLPAGLSLNSSDGRISGVPTTAGIFNVTVSVNDPVGGLAQTSLPLTIK